MKNFRLVKKSKKSKARLGTLTTTHGKIKTPFFMPIATKGAVKNISVDELNTIGAQIILSNTYHLYLKPGEKLVNKMGGLHSFMSWKKPILTDSGGYQVFSLSGAKGKKEKLVTISKRGVEFRSHIDGSRHFFTPEKSIQIQQQLGVDIMMAFDVCPPLPSTKTEICQSVDLTTAWARRCKKEWEEGKYHLKGQQLFGIVQGGTSKEERVRSAKELAEFDFSGYAIGGLAVGEPRDDMYEVLSYVTDHLPIEKPRYLMGLGRPEEIVSAVRNGVDMFDCVIPTREARHGRLYQFCGKGGKDAVRLFGSTYYRMITVTNQRFRSSTKPIVDDGSHPLLQNHTLGYLHHLMKTEEGLGFRLATLANLDFYLRLMSKIREEIGRGDL